MIEHYTIKFGPAVSQKELENALHESGNTPGSAEPTQEFGDFGDLKNVAEMLKDLSGK